MPRSAVRNAVLTLLAACAAVFVLPFDGTRAGAQGNTVLVDGHEAVPGEALVKFRTPGPPADLRQETDAVQVEAVGGRGVHRIRSRSLDAQTLVQSLRRRGDVLYAEPNYVLHADLLPNDTYIGLLWGLVNNGQSIGGQAGVAGADISADSAWNVTTGSRAAVVGVVDTGVTYSHPDLVANIWSAPSTFSVTIGGTTITCAAGTHGFNAIAKSCDPLDDNDHGTHVSGTIGAQGNNGVGVTGVNWVASIMGLKFLDKNGSGSTSDAINAIDFAIKVKKLFATQANVRVLSNSWGGGGFSQALLDEINLAGTNEMLFVAAAGNAGTNNDATPSYPASYNAANLVAVAATDNRDALASFSNYGATSVDLGAPGVSIASTVRSGYAYMSGTSMATPHVSGAAALALAACSSYTTADLVRVLKASVDPVASLAGKTVTGGRLNAYKAVTSCTAPAPTPDFSLSVTPSSQAVTAGGSTSFSVSMTAINAYAGHPSLSVSGLPQGAGATFNPTTLSPSSTLAITTSSATAAGSYPFTVTATDGTLTHTATATLVVNAAASQSDFALSASPASLSVRRGSSGATTITITGTGGFASPVTLSASSLPSGVGASFGTNPTTSASTLTLTAANTAKRGTTSITITGVSGALTHSTTVQLQVR